MDDDKNIRELLRQELETTGYSVMEAVDGMEALNIIKGVRPDLIVLDVMMPGISGFDVAAVIKNDPLTMNIPIIILSICEDKERGFKLGIDRYLTKPVDIDALLKEVGVLVSQGGSKKKVMVMDETESSVKALTEALESRGFQAVGVCEGSTCVEEAVRYKPDLIIMDKIFSEKHDVVKTIRYEKGLENVFFIFMAVGGRADG
ncbi:MAG: response regulator [Deltaproteobacteria bacterium]|nr:response regulator [Deltaproteobacteria bacterium]